MLLTNIIETYLKLSAEEEIQYETLTSQSEDTEVEEMRNLYEERLMVKGARNVLLDQMLAKFGEVPEQAEAKVRSISDDTQLKTLLRRILTADTLADMKLEEA